MKTKHEDPPASQSLRPVKVLLPVDVVRRMDEVIFKGLGGYTNRHDFARDALESHALELLFGSESEIDPPFTRGGHSLEPEERLDTHAAEGSFTQVEVNADDTMLGPARLEMKSSSASLVPLLGDVSETAIGHVERGLVTRNELATTRAEPLIGLHNRDWPSLWALGRFAHLCREDSQPLRKTYAKVTADAWDLSRSLSSLEVQTGAKLRSLLPSNEAKRHAAEAGFQAFAIGAVNRRPDERGQIITNGPLFVWGALALNGSVSDPKVGLTEGGWELLHRVEGLNVLSPHAEEHALAFLGFVREYAPADWFGFNLILECASERVGRVELGERFLKVRDWKESVAVSTSQGYLARSREWGLVEPKMADGAYSLTPLGDRVLASPPGLTKSLDESE